jgi:hypothetical protein
MNHPDLDLASSDTLADPAQGRVACQDCSLFQLCLPVGFDPSDLAEVDRIIRRRRPIQGSDHRVPSLLRQLLRIMSREMRHDQLLLGKRSADERLAAFLFSLSQRFGMRGYSSSEFNLSMSRNDIANYLGLAVETVSRLFSRLQEEGVLMVRGRHVRLCDLARLRALAGV